MMKNFLINVFKIIFVGLLFFVFIFEEYTIAVLGK